MKTQLSALQDQNKNLIALLEKNKIPIPDSFKTATELINQQNSISTPTSTQGIATINNPPCNTTVTWSTSGIIPTTSASLDKNQPISQKMSDNSSFSMTGSDVTRCVPQSQPNISMYTVSSIMNGFTHGETIVDAPPPNNQSATLAITMPSVSANFENPSIGLPLVVTPNIGSQTLGNLVTTQNVNPAHITLATSSNNLQPSQKIISLGKSTQGGPQGVTQVLLCQGTPPQSAVAQGTSIVNVAGRPLGSQGTSVIGPLVTRGTPIVNVPSVPLGAQGTSVVNVPSGPLLSQGTVNSNVPPRPLPTQGAHIVNVPTAPLATAIANTLPMSQYSSMSSNTGLAIQGPIMTLQTPISSTQLLSVNANRTNSLTGKGNTVVSQNNSSNRSRITSNQAPSVAVITSPQANSVRVIPIATQGLVTLTNSVTPSANPISASTQSSGLVTMNVPTCPIGVGQGTSVVSLGGEAGTFGSINTQQPGFVTLKLPKTTGIQPTLNTPMTSNFINSGTTPTVNLTPSPGTAFVIVRSVPSQQPATYQTLPTQSSIQTTNLTNTSFVGTKITPSTIIQPTIQPTLQQPNTLQTPFTIITTSTPVTAATTKTTNLKSRAVSSASPQPPAKVSKTTNGKKRQSNRTSISSKPKASKQKKSSQRNVVSSASPSVDSSRENVTRERSSSNVDLCQQDMLSIQNFSISSLIPSIESQSSSNKNSPTLTNTLSSNNEMKKQGGSIPRTKPNQPSTSLRLSHSIDALTGRQEQAAVQQQSQQNILSFSAESLLGTGEDLVSSLQPISCATASSTTFSSHNSLNIPSFQDNPAEGSINHTFSNFSAEALISETDLIGISSDNQSTRSNFTQGTQSVKSAPSRTQMFSDFSAESLINSSDLGSGLSYAIDNLISRSDNSENSIAMATVNPNLLHSSTSNLIPDTLGHPVFTHNTSGPLVKNYCDFQNTSNTTTDNQSFTKYGFTSPQKQPKEIFSFKPNGALSYSSMTTSPTYLKHSVDSITASQHNVVSSGSGVFGSPSIGGNTLAGPSFNSLFSLDQINSQQYQVGGNPFAPLSSSLTRTSYQGPTMGSFA